VGNNICNNLKKEYSERIFMGIVSSSCRPTKLVSVFVLTEYDDLDQMYQGLSVEAVFFSQD